MIAVGFKFGAVGDVSSLPRQGVGLSTWASGPHNLGTKERSGPPSRVKSTKYGSNNESYPKPYAALGASPEPSALKKHTQSRGSLTLHNT